MFSYSGSTLKMFMCKIYTHSPVTIYHEIPEKLPGCHLIHGRIKIGCMGCDSCNLNKINNKRENEKKNVQFATIFTANFKD